MLNKSIVFWFLLLIGAGLVYQLAASHLTPKFQEFIALDWEETKGCQREAAPKNYWGRKGIVGSFKVSPAPKLASCRSKPFLAKGPILEFEYAGRPWIKGEYKTYFELIRHDTREKVRFWPPEKDARGHRHGNIGFWLRYRLKLPKSYLNKPLQLRLVDRDPTPSGRWLALRSRVNFYNPPFGIGELNLELTKPAGKLAASVFFGIMLLFFSATVLKSIRTRTALFFTLLLIAVLVHFRLGVYFYWDEWHVIKRFEASGIQAIFERHNEHTIPLFFLLYYLENLLFGDHYSLYQVIGLLGHALNGLLLAELLVLLNPSSKHPRAAANILSAIFVSSSIHAGLLQWAMTHCIILSETAILLALIASLRYYKTGSAIKYGQCLSVALGSALLFGNGFSVLPKSTAAVLLGSGPLGSIVEKRSLKRFGLLLAAIALMLCSVGIVYLANESSGEGHSAQQQSYSSVLGPLQYYAVGSQVGTVLRGLGFCVSETDIALEDVLGIDISILSSGLLLLSLIGALASFVILHISIRVSEDSLWALRMWFLGQAIIAANFMLPALGRWHFGPVQALSLRYSYGALAGLMIMLLPLINCFVKHLCKERRFWIMTVGKTALCFCFAAQFWMLSTYHYNTYHGYLNRMFVSQLQDWFEKMDELSPEAAFSYEGLNTPLAHMYPLHPSTLTPLMGPQDIYNRLHWLKPQKYPYKPTGALYTKEGKRS